jgi:hypothetical protein
MAYINIIVDSCGQVLKISNSLINILHFSAIMDNLEYRLELVTGMFLLRKKAPANFTDRTTENGFYGQGNIYRNVKQLYNRMKTFEEQENNGSPAPKIHINQSIFDYLENDNNFDQRTIPLRFELIGLLCKYGYSQPPKAA